MNKKVWLRKALVLIVITLLLGTGVIPSTIGITEKNITFKEVKSPGYIQDLIDNASDGDIIHIPSGTYYENIIIDKSISLIGADKNTTIIDGGNIEDVIYVSADWVNISGFTIREGSDGIELYSNLSTIRGNNISNNGKNGILLYGSNGNNITGNTITDNNEYGIILHGALNDIISENIISNNIISNNNGTGVYFYWSKNSNITGNMISSNREGIRLTRSTYNTIQGNNIISNNREGIIITHSSYCYYNNIIDNNISNNWYGGINLGNLGYNKILDNTITSNHGGIIFSGTNTTISGNSFFNDGLYVWHSYHNTVENNTVNGKPLVYLEDESDKVIDYEAGQVILVNCNNIKVENLSLSNTNVGIELWGTKNSEIESNNCSNINGYAIYLEDSSFNTITGNIFSNNGHGISLRGSSKFNIISNNIISNNNEGILLSGYTGVNFDFKMIFRGGSILNSIIKNNFINNNRDAFFQNSRLNRWKQNYWNRSQLLPKPIFGELYWVSVRGFIVTYIHLPWIPQFDWHPAKEPYDI